MSTKSEVMSPLFDKAKDSLADSFDVNDYQSPSSRIDTNHENVKRKTKINVIPYRLLQEDLVECFPTAAPSLNSISGHELNPTSAPSKKAKQSKQPTTNPTSALSKKAKKSSKEHVTSPGMNTIPGQDLIPPPDNVNVFDDATMYPTSSLTSKAAKTSKEQNDRSRKMQQQKYNNRILQEDSKMPKSSKISKKKACKSKKAASSMPSYDKPTLSPTIIPPPPSPSPTNIPPPPSPSPTIIPPPPSPSPTNTPVSPPSNKVPAFDHTTNKPTPSGTSYVTSYSSQLSSYSSSSYATPTESQFTSSTEYDYDYERCLALQIGYVKKTDYAFKINYQYEIVVSNDTNIDIAMMKLQQAIQTDVTATILNCPVDDDGNVALESHSTSTTTTLKGQLFDGGRRRRRRRRRRRQRQRHRFLQSDGGIVGVAAAPFDERNEEGCRFMTPDYDQQCTGIDGTVTAYLLEGDHITIESLAAQEVLDIIRTGMSQDSYVERAGIVRAFYLGPSLHENSGTVDSMNVYVENSSLTILGFGLAIFSATLLLVFGFVVINKVFGIGNKNDDDDSDRALRVTSSSDDMALMDGADLNYVMGEDILMTSSHDDDNHHVLGKRQSSSVIQMASMMKPQTNVTERQGSKLKHVPLVDDYNISDSDDDIDLYDDGRRHFSSPSLSLSRSLSQPQSLSQSPSQTPLHPSRSLSSPSKKKRRIFKLRRLSNRSSKKNEPMGTTTSRRRNSFVKRQCDDTINL